jgi:signal transduction histidine kinase
MVLLVLILWVWLVHPFGRLADGVRYVRAQRGLSLPRLGRRVAEMTVLDPGPGIPDCAQDKVFEKFYALVWPHSHKKGTGLSLSFVNEIAALHRGRISLKTAQWQGEGGAGLAGAGGVRFIC